MIRATLDTNVLVSGLAALELPTSTPDSIMHHWLDNSFELVVSATILAELERTLTKPYYRSRRSPAHIATSVQIISSQATFVVPSVIVSRVASHPEDDLVLITAVSADVGYLVPGDRQLQRLSENQGVTILPRRAFLDLLELGGDWSI